MKLNNANDGLNISLSYRGLNPKAIWRALVEAQVRKLQELASIVSAKVTLERQRQVKPEFRVFATVAVPGPDFHAEAKDYTLQAALLKAINSLRRQMQSRKNRQLERRKSHAKTGLLHGRSRFVLNEIKGAARRLGPQRASVATS
jgi:ribosomal subunit interface protein